MRLSTVAGLVSAAGLAVAQAPSINDFSAADVESGEAFHNLSTRADQTIRSNIGSRTDPKCTYSNAAVRREWRHLSQDTRKNFTDAVTCLQRLPPQQMTPEEAPNYPGVKSRYDEFVATHINYTLNIHDTADFLAWHRAFAFFFERDLQQLCGYTDVLPYWNWPQDAAAPQNSPLFNGDEYSLGGNGKFVPGRHDTWLAQQDLTYPPGTGGGCIQQGPFKDYTVNLGPLDTPNVQNVKTPYQHNPRCLERDINPWFSRMYTTYTNVTTLMLENIYVEDFQALMQGYNSDTNKFGVHGGGHWQVGGSLVDFHSSPGDPVFYLHHAQIDRIWTIWQNLDIYRRQTAINGTMNLGCSSPSCPQMQLTDKLPFGLVAEDQTFSDLMDTFNGPFCYRYE